MLRFFTVVFLVFNLVSCGYIFDDTGYLRDHHEDYKKESNIDHIALPEQLLHDRPKEAYPVPDVEDRALPDGEIWKVPKPPVIIDIEEGTVAEVDPEEISVTKDQINLTKDGNGYTVIMMDMEFNWAWALVGEAMKKASIKIEDLNRDKAVYYVKVNIDSMGKSTKKSQVYEVKLNYTSNGVQVAMQNNEDALAPQPVAQEILTRIHENL